MIFVGLAYGSIKERPCLYIQAKPEISGLMYPVDFNEKSARVAVRRYIKGNLNAALSHFDDGANPIDESKNKTYARSLRHMLMIPGNGPGGFLVDFGGCKK